MTDLFRGYDLTAVADRVAEAQWARDLAASDLTDKGKAERTWDLLPATVKHSLKSRLLPIITDVLDALDDPTVQPTPDKTMSEYVFPSPSNHEKRHENHRLDAATTWVLHFHVKPSYKDRILARMAKEVHTTGEYTYGDSFREWNEPSDGPHDVRLGIFYDASPAQARAVGTALATAAAFAVDDPDMAKPVNVTISTSGDYAEQMEIE